MELNSSLTLFGKTIEDSEINYQSDLKKQLKYFLKAITNVILLYEVCYSLCEYVGSPND